MAKETLSKENPVVEVLRKLKEDELELINKLKPVQEAISALEKIVDKTVKKKSSKESTSEVLTTEDSLSEAATEG